MQAVSLAQQALDAVAHHSAPELGADRQSDTVYRAPGLHGIDHQKRGRRRFPTPVQPTEFVILLDSIGVFHS